ncbi:MAG: hypothetical protein PHH49_05415 [Candidatus Omnitrophica bacterium]|nr:hypothetical protein [Candidatus Omnitrophota bacterium]MDD5488381.1 hypothetical protein [Candidatus Omnitrophota bacterium]
MIEINLLPKELRKKRKEKEVKARPTVRLTLPKIKAVPVVSLAVVVLILLHAGILFFAKSTGRTLDGLKSKWEQMEPQRAKIAKISSDTKLIEDKVRSLKSISRPQLNWTRILSGLNQSVISNVWLYELEVVSKVSGAKGKKLQGEPVSIDIKGYALGESDKATALVARFINSLKSNNKFAQYFDDIELDSINNSKITGQEVMRFQLDCKLKAPEQEKAVKKTAPKKKKTRSK